LAAEAMQTATELIRPGVRESDVMAEVYRKLIQGTDEFGGDSPIWPNIGSGLQTDSPHLTWSDKPFAADTPVNLELAGCRARYYTGISRSFYLGTAPQELHDIASAVDDGFEAALEVLRPGATCAEV